MKYIEAIVALLAGLGAFLIGFKLLSDNIEKLANSGLKKLFNKTSKNRFIGVGIGILVTAIIQSSSATTVMIVGFVNAGIMDLFQATAMIMGANIGTTITAQIVALQAFDISQFAMLFAFVGIFLYMLAKKDKTKTIGMALGGLGLVFLALKYMSNSMAIFKESDTFVSLLTNCNNPFLLLLIGIAFTALIQSSSATTTILISMVGAGISIGTNSNAVLYVVLGSNVGTCITALLSSIGTSTNARRASCIHLLFNTFGALIFFLVLLCWPTFMDVTFGKWFVYPATQLAMFHTFFNVIMTLVFIPFMGVFVKLATFLIPDKKEKEKDSLIDERFLKTPTIAISQVSKEIMKMGKLAMDALNMSIDGFINQNMDQVDKINEYCQTINEMNQSILSYLVKISSNDLSREDEEYISTLHHNINDFYREAELADNMVKYTRNLIRDELVFSTRVYEQIRTFKDKLNQQFINIEKIYEEHQYGCISLVDALENEMDELRSNMIEEHILRLEKGECQPNSSGVYINLVSNLERAGDHLEYIAHRVVGESMV